MNSLSETKTTKLYTCSEEYYMELYFVPTSSSAHVAWKTGTNRDKTRTNLDKNRTNQDQPGSSWINQDKPGQIRTNQDKPGQTRIKDMKTTKVYLLWRILLGIVFRANKLIRTCGMKRTKPRNRATCTTVHYFIPTLIVLWPFSVQKSWGFMAAKRFFSLPSLLFVICWRYSIDQNRCTLSNLGF